MPREPLCERISEGPRFTLPGAGVSGLPGSRSAVTSAVASPAGRVRRRAAALPGRSEKPGTAGITPLRKRAAALAGPAGPP
ncbi:hypothetical protein ACH44C_20625 [Streptomyces purpureus]|uniref:hypothetical protein n=1 Tax=Streptomyces purpureus TaxID=1951 RepID=UPI00379AF394